MKKINMPFFKNFGKKNEDGSDAGFSRTKFWNAVKTFFTHDIIAKILCVFAAVCLWSYVIDTQSTTYRETYSGVEVTFRNTGTNRKGLEVMSSDRYTVARINATHDSIYSFAHMKDAGVLQLKHQGYIWYDPDSTFYLAPEKSAARAYITAIARECAEMGFNELLFDEFGYPPRGRLSNVDESARTMTKQEALSLLAGELRESVKEQGVKLSVELDAQTVLTGSNEKTGQVLSSLAAEFDRIYVPTTAEQLPELRAAMEPYDAELVPILSGPAAEGSYLLAAQN